MGREGRLGVLLRIRTQHKPFAFADIKQFDPSLHLVEHHRQRMTNELDLWRFHSEPTLGGQPLVSPFKLHRLIKLRDQGRNLIRVHPHRFIERIHKLIRCGV